MSQSEDSSTVISQTDLPARQLDFSGGTSNVEQQQLLAQPSQPIVGPLPQLVIPSQSTPILQQPMYMAMQQPSELSAPPAHSSILRLVRPESPNARSRQNVNEVQDGIPKKQKCHSRHSRCLKLYCECFTSGIYCDGCNCVNCHNNEENDATRREAVEATLERNPNALRPRIASIPHGARESREEMLLTGMHNKGCHCKISGCLKKYCRVFPSQHCLF